MLDFLWTLGSPTYAHFYKHYIKMAWAKSNENFSLKNISVFCSIIV